ncbi:fungal-specific transcription factor domain-containing protein [Xylariales sp. PMI_506]|nr:fungal-specific transcription factor domain-containing protein [Xylariales sp. PMI_506]
MRSSGLRASHTPPARQRHKKGSVCTQCRQLKFKCDAAELFPAPCSRCAKSGHPCKIDPNFKRTAHKQRLDSLEKQVQQLRHELSLQKANPASDASTPSDDRLPERDRSLVEGDDIREIASKFPQEIRYETIDGFELPSNIVTALVAEYYKNFHPYFPILPDHDMFLTRANANKLLLWTVLAIASRESAQHSNLFATLVDPIRRLAGNLYSSQSRSFETVQALLLLATWPFPFQQTINDPSPMYVTLATQIAYQLGLHRPAFPGDFAETCNPLQGTDEAERRRVWFGCFIIDYAVASKLGLPSTVKPGHAVLSTIARSRLSLIAEPLIGELSLTYVGTKALAALGDNEYASDGMLPDCLPVVRAFESELIDIHERFTSTWPQYLELFYYAQLLQLYSFVLVSKVSTNQMMQIDAASNEIYGKAVSCCTRLSSIASSKTQESRFWPAFMKYSILYGVIFAIPLANMEDHGSPQRNELLHGLQDGIILMKSWSLFEKDHWSRISSHATFLLRKLKQANQSQDDPPVIISGVSTISGQRSMQDKKLRLMSVTSRMAASVLYDTLWTGKRGARREEQLRAQKAQATTLEESSPILPGSIPNGQEDSSSNDNFDSFLDTFAFGDDWGNPDFLDISADWLSMVGTA